MDYELDYQSANEMQSSARLTFIRRTYAHLAGAILAFVALEAALLNMVDAGQVMQYLAGSMLSWLLVLGAFMLASWVAQYWAQTATSLPLQYAGLGLYVAAEAVIFL